MNRHHGTIAAGALFVSLIDMAAVVFGFWIWRLSGTASQIAVQVPVACAVGILGVAAAVLPLSRRGGLSRGEDWAAVLLLAFPCGAAVFTGVHYLVAGYLTAFGNIAALWGVQFALNVTGLPLGVSWERRLQLRSQ